MIRHSPARSGHPPQSAARRHCCNSRWLSRSRGGSETAGWSPMSVLLALPLPLVGAAGPIQGLLTRNRAYKALAGRTLIGQGLGTITGIAAALTGRRRMGHRAAAACRLIGWRRGLAGALSHPPSVHRPLARPARHAAHRPAADRQHAGAARPLPRVRPADRRHRGRGRAWPGAHGVPSGRYGARARLHRAVAADAAAAVGAAGRSAGTARPRGPLPRLVEPAGVPAVRRHGARRFSRWCGCCWVRSGSRPVLRHCR